jgi:apolipoprotein N-acyltransferase
MQALKFLLQRHWGAIISGLAIGLVMAPFTYSSWLVFIVLWPFLWDLQRAENPSAALQKGFFFGLASALSALNWIAFNTIAGYVMLLLLHPWTFMLFALAFYFLWRHLQLAALLPLSIIWVALEAARSWGQLRFPWMNLYYALSEHRFFIQIIEITGPLALSLFIFLTNAVALWLWRGYRTGRAPRRELLAVLVLVFIYVGTAWWGWQRTQSLSADNYPLLACGYVQPDIDAYKKWQPEYQTLARKRLFAFSDSLADQGADLIVWPETAITNYVRRNSGLRYLMQQWSQQKGLPMLIGIVDYAFSGDKFKGYNTAWMVYPDSGLSSDMPVYHKHFLVPGGETIPFKNYLPFLSEINVGGGNAWPGDSLRTFPLRRKTSQGKWQGQNWQALPERSETLLHIIPAICYESVFPDLMRRQAYEQRGNLLAIITNDGWYGNTAGPYQHMQAAIFRAIETRSSVIRAANNGISAGLDHCGRVFASTSMFTTAYARIDLPLVNITTVYERYGHYWLIPLLLSAIVFTAWQMIFRPRNIDKIEQ